MTDDVTITTITEIQDCDRGWMKITFSDGSSCLLESRHYEAINTCGYEFNETQFGWDQCTKTAGHKGNHYDSISKHFYPNDGPGRLPRPRPEARG